MDEAAKVDLLLIKRYLQQAEYAAKESPYYGDIKNPYRQAIRQALALINLALREGK